MNEKRHPCSRAAPLAALVDKSGGGHGGYEKRVFLKVFTKSVIHQHENKNRIAFKSLLFRTPRSPQRKE